MKSKRGEFSADRPISSSRGDKLGRTAFASELAKRIQSWRGYDSLVISLCGEWGSGKTSLKNIIAEKLRRKSARNVDLLEFSPWEISGHGSVTAAFFRELSIILGKDRSKKKSQHRVNKLRAYAKLALLGGFAAKWLGKAAHASGHDEGKLIEVAGDAGAQVGKALQLAVAAQESQDKIDELSSIDLKKALTKEMAELKKPIVVIIDDIDRLTSDEIREVFQLVKANADFPNLIYVLLFDRDIVSKALNGISGDRGQEYLEKIVQVLFHVPRPSVKDVHKVLFDGLDAWLAEKDIAERWETPRWSRVWHDGLSEYYTNLRSVYRFLGSFGFQAACMRNGRTFELNPLDLIILETLRLFESSFYEQIPSNRSLLVNRWKDTGISSDAKIGERKQADVNRLLSQIPEFRRERVREILAQLFPAPFGHVQPDNDALLRSLRVGHEKLFERYFALGLPRNDIAQADIDELIANFTIPEKFAALCQSLTEELRTEAAFERLDAYRNELLPAVFPKIITSLCDVADTFPHKNRIMFERDCLTFAWRLIYFGLRKINSEQVHYDILSEGISLSKGVRLAVQIVNLEERNDRRSSHDFLIKEEQLPELRALAVERLRWAAADGRLRDMQELDNLLFWWRKWTSDGEVHDWVSARIKNSEDALWLLRTLLSVSSRTSDRTVFIRYLSLETLGLYCDPAKIEKLTSAFELKSMSKDNMRALRAFRYAMQWKAEGKKDGYHGERWDRDGPLTEDE